VLAAVERDDLDLRRLLDDVRVGEGDPVASTITPEPRLRCGMRSGASPKKRRKKSSPKNSSNGVRPVPPPMPPWRRC